MVFPKNVIHEALESGLTCRAINIVGHFQRCAAW